MEKTYVITGATSGIGRGLVERFASENIVFAGYRNEKYLESLNKLGVIPFYIDMEKPETILQASEFIKSKTEKVDTLINVAGCVVAGAIEEISVNNIRKQFEINTFSHIDFAQRLRPEKIINISSMASFGIFPFISPYCASKRALDILFNGMALESNIQVISIKPGVIATPLWEKSIELNKDTINNCRNFEKEMSFMVSNARKNGKLGLDVNKACDFIVKIDKLKNPKPSYTIGSDAKFAEIFSKLPFDIQNKLIKFGMKLKFN